MMGDPLMQVRPVLPMVWPSYLKEATIGGRTIGIDRKECMVRLCGDALLSQEARELAMAIIAAADACDAMYLEHLEATA